MKLKIFLLAMVNAIGYSVHAQQQLTGAIGGVFDVSSLGAATYTIPVSVPEGIGGMKPSVSINYNSQNQSNGNLGIGWSVAGASAITRANSTILLDGKMAGATLGSDKFALDGSRFVRTGDLNSTSNYTYATESESFLNIESESAGHVFQSFKVTGSSGIYSEYGINSNTKQTVGGETYAWLLARQTDLNGNTVNYDYYNVSGEEVRMKSITYGGGSTPLNRITFHYVNKATQNFVYLLGQKLESKYKLDKITIESTGGTGNVYTLLYTYQFEYAAQKDQLLKVRHISNFTNQEMPVTNFLYENQAPPEFSSVMALGDLTVNEEIIVGDFNGDGKSDFILYNNEQSGSNNSPGLLHLNNGENDFRIIQGITIPKVPQHYIKNGYHYDRLNRSSFFDFNGDGREDLYTINPQFSGAGTNNAEIGNTYQLFLSALAPQYAGGIQLVQEPNIIRSNTPNRPFPASFPLVGDFDGDGLSEILILAKKPEGTATNVDCYIFGEKYSPVISGSYRVAKWLPTIPFTAQHTEEPGEWERSNIFVIDYNGDGKSDVLYIRQGLAKIYELNVTFDSNNNPVIGNPAFIEISSDGYPTSAHKVYTGDFNGDGITDVLTYVSSVGWEIGYGKGNGKFNDIRSVSSLNMLQPQYLCTYWNEGTLRPIMIADFDGDGKSDICEITDQNAPSAIQQCSLSYQPRIHFSRGNHVFQTQTYPLNVSGLGEISSRYKLGDFNGDGHVDIISQKLQDNSFYIHKFKVFDGTKLLTKVVNGLGLQTRIEYTKYTKEYFPLHNIDVATYFTNVSYPFVSKNLPITLVKSVFNDAGFYGAYEGVIENRVDYTFKRLTWANLGRGMLGYQEVVVNDVAHNVTSVTTNIINNEKLLLLPFTTAMTKNGTAVSSTINQFEVKNFASNRFGVYPKFTENRDNLTGQNIREDFSFQETYTDPMGGTAIESTYHIGKPIKKVTSKGFYKHFLNITGISGALETITETYSYPSPFVVVIGDPTPFYRYFLPNRIQTTTVRKGQDPFSSDVRFVYNNAKGWITKKRDNYGLPHAVTTDYTYNTFGNLLTQTVSSTGCPTVAETTEYDPTNRFVKSKYNAAYPLLKSNCTYNGYTGWINTAVDNVRGLTQTFTYDGFGRTTSVTDNTGLQTTTAILSPQQGSPDDTRYTVAEFNNITSKSVWKHYDRLGRLLRTGRFDFNGDVLFEDVNYNLIGQMTSSSLPYNANGGTPVNTSFGYDNLGRQNQITAPNGNTLISYNLVNSVNSTNNLSRYTVTTTGTDGVLRATVTDAAGKKIQATDPGGSLDFTYHSSGQVLNTVLNGSMVTRSAYNGAGREVEKYDLNYGTFQYTYDNYGKLKTQIDPKGNQYLMDYDALGNLITKTGPEGAYNYSYNLSTAGFNLGKLTGITAPGGISESYSYGSFGRLTQEVKTIDGISFTNAYAYDAFGRLARKYFANFIQGITLNYGYNANDGSYERTYLNGGTIQNPKNLYTVLKKNEWGQTTMAGLFSIEFGGGNPTPEVDPYYKLNTFKVYDSFGFLKVLTTTPSNNYGNNFTSNYYSFNSASGNLNSRMDEPRGDNGDYFTYDGLNRLTSTTIAYGISGPYSGNFYYNNNGNITEKSDAGTFTYNSANKVAEIAPFTNIPSETQTITYTPFDKVETIKEGNITAHFKYWPDGQRAKMELKNNGVTYRTKYYMENFEREISSGQTRDLAYVGGENDQYVSIIERINNTNEKTYSVMTDYLGSIERIVDNNTLAIVADKNHDAWGRERDPNDWSYLPTTRNSNGWDCGYTGHEHIPEFGLINMNGRLYDPVLGRMLSPDPYIMGVDNTQGYNRYTYALNNPMAYTDPSGEWVAPVMFAMSFIVNYAANLTSGRENAFKSALGVSNDMLGALSNAGRLTLSSGENHRWSAGFDMLGFGLSVRYDYFNGNFSGSASAGVYFSPTGVGAGVGAGASYQLGDWNVGLGIGSNFKNFSGSASVSYFNGTHGGTLGLNYYSGNDAQFTGTFGYRYKDFSIAMENDMLPKYGEDKWRTGAFTVGYKNYFMAANIYTNDGAKESKLNDYSDPKHDVPSPIWGHNPKKEAWAKGLVLRSSLSFGYRYGTATSSLGTSWRGVQDFLQNGIHRRVLPTPYYLDYSQMYRGMYYESGPKNIYSAW